MDCGICSFGTSSILEDLWKSGTISCVEPVDDNPHSQSHNALLFGLLSLAERSTNTIMKFLMVSVHERAPRLFRYLQDGVK
jgi:hypothetical protein